MHFGYVGKPYGETDYEGPSQNVGALIMKPEFHLHRAHKRIRRVGASEGVAGVEHVALVRDVGADKTDHPVFADGLPNRQIKRVVAGQMTWTVTVEKARSIVKGDCSERTPRQIALEACR